MEATERGLREHQFVDQMGLLFGEIGGSAMMGRIVGHLLICDPPEQSSPQLAEALGASKGAISTLTRQLVRWGMVEKVAVRGKRATYFRIRANGFVQQLRTELATVRMMRELAESGLELLAEDPPARRNRLEGFRGLYEFVEHEMERIVDQWVATHPEHA